MKSIELFRKAGYKQRYNNYRITIYDLKEKEEYSSLPDTIIITKNNNDIELTKNISDFEKRYGDGSIILNKELLQAINKKTEENE